jgi:cytochrome c peroxidase
MFKPMAPMLLVVTLASLGCQPSETTAPNSTNAASEAAVQVKAEAANVVDAAVTAAAAEAEQVVESVEQTIGDAATQAADAITEKIDEATAALTDTEPVSLMLGTDDLTSGIPGEGDLTLEQIQAWLADPENHRVIQPELPLGLSAAVANIQHIDTNPMTRAKIELGRQLYFDTRLSSDGTISCASCHHPDEGYGRATRFGVGVGGQEGNRNSPVSYNRIVSGPQFWDGRAASLEEQAGGPIANPIEMGNTHEAALEAIQGIEGYRVQFEKIFPSDGINIDTVTKAIATFERAIVTLPAPYDYYEKVRTIEASYGDELEEMKEEDPEFYAEYEEALAGSAAMSESAKRGRELFFSDRVGCTACHAGANFTDELYHNLGVGMDVENPDLGRYEVTKKEADKGAFKTPTMRNVALSAPYMHDGSQQTLEEVVEWYAKGGHPNPYLSDKVKKFDVTEQEKKDLVAFMVEGLTSGFPAIRTDRLPQ